MPPILLVFGVPVNYLYKIVGKNLEFSHNYVNFAFKC